MVSKENEQQSSQEIDCAYVENMMEEMGFKFGNKTGSVIMEAPKRTLHKGDDSSKDGNNGLRDQKRNQ